jgi:hypothetical protein
MGANKPFEDIEATLLAATKSALDELVWWAHATMAARRESARSIASPREWPIRDLLKKVSLEDAKALCERPATCRFLDVAVPLQRSSKSRANLQG